MAPSDTAEPFRRIPWAATLLNQPNTIIYTPSARTPKPSTEDSLFAETLKTPRTLRSVVSFYTRPATTRERVPTASTLMTLGSGINGHPGTAHGGLVAVILDEAMGILQTINHERAHLAAVATGAAHGELPPAGHGLYTAELKITYRRPVAAPGALLVTASYVRADRGKEWMRAEIKQRVGATEDDDGDEVLCAIGEGLFVRPKWLKL